MASLVSFEQIVAAAYRIKGHIRLTPCPRSDRLSRIVTPNSDSIDMRNWKDNKSITNVYIKKDNLQHTGAYKERGALNKLKSLSKAETDRGVFAASAGNHAQGLAYHAGNLGIKSTIFMPIGTPNIKVSRTKFYGADVRMEGFNYDEASAACLKECAEKKGVLVHPFDDLDIIAGQGTMGLEIMDEVPKVDVIIAPIGGGGMISGVAKAAKSMNPNVKIIGVEPIRIPTMQLACKHPEGLIEIHRPVATIADGINVRQVGKLTTQMCRELVDEFVTVTEEEICRAILFLLEGEKIVAEGAGAAAVAALMSGKITGLEGKNVVAIITGGNIDVNVIAQVIELGLMDSGRRVNITVDNLPDRPGSLARVMQITSDNNCNVVSVSHHRSSANYSQAGISMTLDVKNADHTAQLVEALVKNGFTDVTANSKLAHK